MRVRVVHVSVLAVFTLLVQFQHAAGAPIIRAEVRAFSAGVNDFDECNQRIFGGLADSFILSCGAAKDGGDALINAMVNTNGVLGFGGSVIAHTLGGGRTSIVGGSIALLDEFITIHAPAGQSNGFVQLTGNTTGSMDFTCLNNNFDTNPGLCYVEGAVGSFVGIAGQSLQVSGGRYAAELQPRNGFLTHTLVSELMATVLVPVPFADPIRFSYNFVAGARVGTEIGIQQKPGPFAQAIFSFADPPFIEVFDANGNPLADAFVTSDSGIDYNLPQQVPDVPEPAGLLLVALGAIGAVSRARTRLP